jgi:DNA invertase Pin-like site-specific DNA recombinase
MNRTIAYLRTSTDKQDLNSQKLEILEFARRKNMTIDDFIEVTISSRKSPQERRIEELTSKLQPSDTLVITELSRIGRSTAGVIALINELVTRNVRVIIIKQSLDLYQQDMNAKIIITLFSLFNELERDLISSRTKEALAVKKGQGIKLGKPKGTLQKSKFDKHIDRIKELLKLGLSVRKITKLFGFQNHISLNNYLNKRNIKKQITLA